MRSGLRTSWVAAVAVVAFLALSGCSSSKHTPAPAMEGEPTSLKVALPDGSVEVIEIPPGKGLVMGTVRSDVGNLLAGSKVKLDHAETVTDSAGGFVFSDVPLGKARMEVVANGYQSAEDTLE